MKVLPFFANYSYPPRMGVKPHHHAKVKAADEFTNRMKQIHDEVQAALIKAQDEMKRYADYHCRDPPKYEVGQKVWLETENLKLKRPSKKLTEKRVRPCPIVEIKSSNTVQLKLPQMMKIHPIVSISHIRPYRTPQIP